MFTPPSRLSYASFTPMSYKNDGTKGSITASNITTSNNNESTEKDMSTTPSPVVLEASLTAQSEANRRRGIEETYTAPITTTSVRTLTQVTEFMSDFNKFAETYESTFQNHLQEYKNDLQPIYNRLVPQEVTHKTFIQRYFFRCGDLQRIQDDLDDLLSSKQQETQSQINSDDTDKKEIPAANSRINTDQSMGMNGGDQAISAVRWRGVSNDDPSKRAAWEATEGARLSFRAAIPPTQVQRKPTIELESTAAKAANQATRELSNDRVLMGSWISGSPLQARSPTNPIVEDSSQVSDQTPLYSRLRDRFRANQRQQLSAVPKITCTDNSSNRRLSRSESPAPSSLNSGDSDYAEDGSTKDLPSSQRKSTSVESRIQKAFASVRSQWETDGKDTTLSQERPNTKVDSTSDLIEYTPVDSQQLQHMSLNAAESVESMTNQILATGKPQLSSSALSRPTRDSNAVPSRSNSARDLYLEAVNKERRDRTLGPPVTQKRGVVPRRLSESNTIQSENAGLGRGSLRTFRSSSFAYRNRGLNLTQNDLAQSSNHSVPANDPQLSQMTMAKRAAEEPGSAGIDSSHAYTLRTRGGTSVGGGSRRNLLSRRRMNSQSSEGTFAESTVDLDHSNSSLQHDHEDTPIPKHITTSRPEETGTSTSKMTSVLLIVEADPLALKSVLRAARRRNLSETYTQPIEMREAPGVKKFLESFDLQEWKDEAALALAKYQDLALQHEALVLRGEITEKDFWCRYFCKCDEKRILEDLRNKQRLGILGQSSRNVFTNSSAVIENNGGRKSFTRGPHLKQQGSSSFLGTSFQNAEKYGGASDLPQETQTETGQRNNSQGNKNDVGSLKEKLRDWNKITTTTSSSGKSESSTSLSAEVRARRYRTRSIQ